MFYREPMRLLLLGGIGEAIKCAEKLHESLLETAHTLVYSLLGKGRYPSLDCDVRVGGFGGVTGLIDYIAVNDISMLVDITHPYATKISQNAIVAADTTGIPLWAYRRPSWQGELGVDSYEFSRWSELMALLKPYYAPLFSIGQAPFEHIDHIPTNQHWYIRCVQRPKPEIVHYAGQYTALEFTGPFELEQELNVLQTHKIDVLVTKNSGGSSISAKLDAAKQLNIPICVLKRPRLPKAHREFDKLAVLTQEILYHCKQN